MDQNKPAPRTSLDFEVVFKKNYARAEERGCLKNISISGAFLDHNNSQLQPGDKLSLTILVSSRVRQIPALVVWKNGDGCGVKFNPQNRQDSQIVDDFIYFVESKKQETRALYSEILKKVA